MQAQQRLSVPFFRSCAGVLGLALWLGLLPCAVLAREKTPIDLTISPGGELYDQRFSWLHWWETERSSQQRFADDAAHRAWQARRRAALKPYHDEIVEKLEGLVMRADADPYARAGGVMALARMGHADLLELLVSDEAPPEGYEEGWPMGLVGDQQVRVRAASWLALGILGTPECRDQLVDVSLKAVTVDDEIARLTAFGLLDELSDFERAFVVRTMRESDSAEVQRMALWALGQHDSRANDKLMRAAVRELKSPYSVSEAMLSEGSMQRLDMGRLMKAVVSHDKSLNEVFVFKAIENGAVWTAQPTFGVRQELQVAAELSLMELAPLGATAERALMKELGEVVREGPNSPDGPGDVEGLAPVRNYERGPAALALAMQVNSQGSMDTAVESLVELLEGRTLVSYMAYPRDGNGTVDRSAPPQLVKEVVVQRENPARGYSAVAIGLMLQRMNAGTRLGRERPLGLGRASQYANFRGDLERPMVRVLQDKGEVMDVRCGVAIGLGLSGDPGYRKALRETIASLGSGDAALYGYCVEALAMLGDEGVPKLVEKYLSSRNGKVAGDTDRLCRRALASALVFSAGVDESVDQVLVEAWPHDPWVSMTLARASAVHGGSGMIEHLIGRLDDPEQVVQAAISLGELVDTQSPWRLSPLVEGMNYTIDFRTPIGSTVEPECVPNPVAVYVPPTDQPVAPARMFAGFENPYLMHELLLRRRSEGNASETLDNDDSNGLGQFMFRPQGNRVLAQE